MYGDKTNYGDKTIVGIQILMAGAIYHGCHKGSQLCLVTQDAEFANVVVVPCEGGWEDLHLFLLLPIP